MDDSLFKCPSNGTASMSLLAGGSGMKRDPHGVGVGGHRKLDCVAEWTEIDSGRGCVNHPGHAHEGKP